MDRFDKIIYDRYMNGHPIQRLKEKYNEDVYDLVDFFYKGRNSCDSKLVEAVEDVSKIQLLKHATKGNAWRAMQSAYDILSHLDKNKGQVDTTNEDDFKASLQNMYAGEKFSEELEKSRDEQNKTDFLLTSNKGSGVPGEMSQEDIQFRNWLANRSKASPEIREILDCFGRFLAHANKLKKEKYFPSVANITNVTQGKDLSKLLPSEYLGLVVPELEDYFNYKYATGSLLQYENKEKIETGKGGVHLVLDLSGSMYDPLDKCRDLTKKINVAIGFALAMIKILEEEDRRCVIHVFNLNCWNVFDSKKQGYKKGMMDIIQLYPHDSTDIKHALQKVFVPEYEDLDVIMVTDGLDDTLRDGDIVKGDKNLSCLLVSQYSPGSTALSRLADSFIVANDRGGFEHLVEQLLK
jgi:uncharacterized protein with von Willebrand factor type A (vWA) domain